MEGDRQEIKLDTSTSAAHGCPIYIKDNSTIALINTIYSNDVTLVVLQKMYVLLDTLAKVWFIYIEPVRLLSDLNHVTLTLAAPVKQHTNL